MFEPDKKQEWVAKNKEKRVYCELLAKGAPIATVGPDPEKKFRLTSTLQVIYYSHS